MKKEEPSSQLDLFTELYEKEKKELDVAYQLLIASKNCVYLSNQLSLAIDNEDFNLHYDSEMVYPNFFNDLATKLLYLRSEIMSKYKKDERLPYSNYESLPSEGFRGTYNQRSTHDWYDISKRDLDRLKRLILANSDIWENKPLYSGIMKQSVETIDLIILRFKKLAEYDV